jgi:hypothetical protein
LANCLKSQSPVTHRGSWKYPSTMPMHVLTGLLPLPSRLHASVLQTFPAPIRERLLVFSDVSEPLLLMIASHSRQHALALTCWAGWACLLVYYERLLSCFCLRSVSDKIPKPLLLSRKHHAFTPCTKVKYTYENIIMISTESA